MVKIEKYSFCLFKKVDEKCTKGYIHKGKAYTFLKEFDKAQVEFEAAKKYDPKQTKLIDGNFIF